MVLIQVQAAAINTTGSYDNFSSVEVQLRSPHAVHLTLGLSSRSAKRSNTVEKYSSRISRLLGAGAESRLRRLTDEDGEPIARASNYSPLKLVLDSTVLVVK